MFNGNAFWKLIAAMAEEKAKRSIEPDDSYQNRDNILYNERRTPKTDFVNKISVDTSCFDISIIAANVSGVEAVLKGRTSTPDKIIFTTEVIENELIVRVRVKAEFFKGDISLEVLVPSEQKFKEISASTSSGDIEVSDKLKVETLKIDTRTGDVDLTNLKDLGTVRIKTSTGDITLKYATANSFQIDSSSGDVFLDAEFSNLTVKTSTGDIDVHTTAKSNIIMVINTSSGDVSVDLDNIGILKKVLKTTVGDIDYNHVNQGKYEADIRVITTTGDIEIS